MINIERVILASASPRRIELLSPLLGRLEVIPSKIDEGSLDGEKPAEHVQRLAEEKARHVAQTHQEAWVIGADTVVFIDGMILGKPQSYAQAQAMLTRLSGRKHLVYTGFSIMKLAAGKKLTRVVESAVTFREIAADEMSWYLNCDEPYDKAGAYAVQGQGAFFIREIQGSYTNVMGLPLCELVDSLKALGVIVFDCKKDGLVTR